MRFFHFIVRFAIWVAMVPAQQYPSLGNDVEGTGTGAQSINGRKLQSWCTDEIDACRSDLQTLKDECSVEPQPETESIFSSIWNFFFPPAADPGTRYLQTQGKDS